MFPGQCGNTAFFFKSQPDQFHFEFRGIVFPGKSFFSAHEVSTCKISGCLSYRILDSGPDGTQTTLTNEQDISHALKFVETESELLHLSLLCDDAEFFPDLQDELRKTPAIEKRSRQLSRALMKKGFEPIFMEMDEKQQLIAGNAMLRQMAKIADPDDKMEGYRKVANYIEAGEYLSNHKLFNAGMNALSDKALRLENLTQPALLEG